MGRLEWISWLDMRDGAAAVGEGSGCVQLAPRALAE